MASVTAKRSLSHLPCKARALVDLDRSAEEAAPFSAVQQGRSSPHMGPAIGMREPETAVKFDTRTG